MYTIDDIQIFLITHNRANLIGESIESLLNQTAGVKEITVLDNESTDNTEEIVKSYASRGVKYIKTFGFLGNYYKAKEIADKKFLMLFHDDDILHPDYLACALKIMNKENSFSAFYTKYTEFKDNDSPKTFSKLKSKYHLFKTKRDFAIYMFFVEGVAYATAIYDTELFKKTDLEYSRFSKFNDWPFMVKFGDYGNILLFEDTAAFHVRKHANQDTNTYTNVPLFEQIVNWDKFFYDIFFEKDDKLLKELYSEKSLYFLDGKYDAFVPPEIKKDFNKEQLHILAEKMGLEISLNNYQEHTKKYKKFQAYIRCKNLNNSQIKIMIRRIKYLIQLIKG